MASSRRRLIGQLSAALVVLVGVVAGFTWSALAPVTYQASGSVFVKFNFPATEPDPFSAQQFVTQRIDSYAELATSPAVLSAVQRDLPGYTLDELAAAIDVAAVPGTVLIDATATASDPRAAAEMADAVLAQLAATVTVAEGAGSMQASPVLMPLIQPAIAPDTTSSSVDFVKVLVGAGLGSAVGALVWWVSVRGGIPVTRPSPPRHARPADLA